MNGENIKMNQVTNHNLTAALEAAKAACHEILQVYHSFDQVLKTKADHSPLTLADKRSHEVILKYLSETGIPVLSEEGKEIPYDIRKNWEYLWLVDPLDGTKEFLNRNGEFTVNIALINRHEPVLGVVAVPVTGDIYFGGKGIGAFVARKGSAYALPVRRPVDLRQPGLRVVASRSHMDEQTQAFIESLNNPVLVSRGSSLKFMMLAEGRADVYPRFAPTMEWDTAAAHAIILPLNGGIYCLQNESKQLIYNKIHLINEPFLSF